MSWQKWALKNCMTVESDVLRDKIHIHILKYHHLPSSYLICYEPHPSTPHTTTICLISCSSPFPTSISKTWTKLFWGHQHKQCSGLLQIKRWHYWYLYFLPIYHINYATIFTDFFLNGTIDKVFWVLYPQIISCISPGAFYCMIFAYNAL